MSEIHYRYAYAWNITRRNPSFAAKYEIGTKYEDLKELLKKNANMSKRNRFYYSLWSAFLVYSNLRAAVSKFGTSLAQVTLSVIALLQYLERNNVYSFTNIL